MTDPKPLLLDAGLGEDLRAVLEARSAHEPAASDLAALGKRLAAALPPGTLPLPDGPGPLPRVAPSAGAPPPGLASSAVGKLAIGLVVAAAIGGGLWLARSNQTSEPAPPVASVERAVAPPPATPATAVAESPPIASASPSATLPGSPTPRPSSEARPSPAPSAPPEAALLARAHDELLHGDAEKALATATEHARAYPRGGLSQEREVIAIEALVALGRGEEARRRAAAFHRTYPGSSHAVRIDRLVAP